jgi:hypothetical protein
MESRHRGEDDRSYGPHQSRAACIAVAAAPGAMHQVAIVVRLRWQHVRAEVVLSRLEVGIAVMATARVVAARPSRPRRKLPLPSPGAPWTGAQSLCACSGAVTGSGVPRGTLADAGAGYATEFSSFDPHAIAGP